MFFKISSTDRTHSPYESLDAAVGRSYNAARLMSYLATPLVNRISITAAKDAIP